MHPWPHNLLLFLTGGTANVTSPAGFTEIKRCLTAALAGALCGTLGR